MIERKAIAKHRGLLVVTEVVVSDVDVVVAEVEIDEIILMNENRLDISTTY